MLIPSFFVLQGVKGERNAGEFYFHAKDRRFSPQQHIFSSWMVRPIAWMNATRLNFSLSLALSPFLFLVVNSPQTRDEVLVKLKEHFEKKSKDGVATVTFDTAHSSSRRKRLPPPPAPTIIAPEPPSALTASVAAAGMSRMIVRMFAPLILLLG